MLTNDEMIEASERAEAEEYREMVQELCPDGGFLLGDEEIPMNMIEPTDTLVCPDHLDAIAKKEWARISEEQKSVLTPADAPALAAYCAAYGRWADAEINIQKHGTIIKTKSGNAVANPYVSIAETSMCMMHRFLQLLRNKQTDSVSPTAC